MKKIRGKKMIKKLKAILVAALIVIALFAIYRLLCIRIVNYEIAGVKIPSEYNIITGKIKPILHYAGKGRLPIFNKFNVNKLGLTEDEVAVAQLRWAIFEQWVKAHPEYKDWEGNAETFRKAHAAFRKELETYGPKVKVVR